MGTKRLVITVALVATLAGCGIPRTSVGHERDDKIRCMIPEGCTPGGGDKNLPTGE